MIIVWLVAAVSGVALFVALLPFGWILALIGASLGGSILAALAAVGVAWRSGQFATRQPAQVQAKNGFAPRPNGKPVAVDHGGNGPEGQVPG